MRSHPPSHEFDETFSVSHRVYHKYQTTVHQDPPSKPTERQYTRFLVDSPLTEVQTARQLSSCDVFICCWQVKLMSNILLSYNESYAVFKKYQMTVHNETALDCTKSTFSGFLVDTPLCTVCVCCF